MNWVINNWFVVVGLVVLLIVAVIVVYRFFKLPTNVQKEKVREWLVWACIQAEKDLQSDTGQLKLREVWNMFCTVPAFAWVAKIITFDVFSLWVDEAVKQMKAMLINNSKLLEYVYGSDIAVQSKELAKLKEQLMK